MSASPQPGNTRITCIGNELQEDCLISMLRLNEGQGPVSVSRLSEFMDADIDTVLAALVILSKDEKVVMKDGDVEFTDHGLLLAREVRKKHHVMENFLINVLGMDHEAAHREAHLTEHTMSQESMQKLCHVTGNHQDSDCSACNNPCNSAISIGTLEELHDMDVRTKGTIAYLRGKTPDDVKKLISMGFVPGRTITVESRISSKGPRVVTLGESTVAVDAELSKAIIVNVGV